MLVALLAAVIQLPDIDAILDDPALKGAIAGVCIATLDGEVLYERFGDTRLVPASNQKLLSVTFAISTLGLDFRPVTRFWKEGDTVFIDAPGDPTLTKGQLLKAKQALRIGDDVAIYVRQAYKPVVPPSWEHDDLPHRYAARVTAFSFDKGGFEIWSEDGAIRPMDGAYRITVRHIASDEPERTEYWPEKRLAVVTGKLPKGDSFIEAFAMPDPDVIAARVLGGTIIHTDREPPAREPDYVIQGPPLKDIIKVCLEKSDNNIAEHLMLIAASREEPLGDDHYAEAAERMRAFLVDTVGLSDLGVRPVDGSGMSRHNLVSPSAVCKLLAWAYRQEWRDDFLTALAAPGEGTMSSRLRASSVVGKTGTLNAVVSLSGYVRAGDGRTLTVSLLFNHTIVPAREVRAVQDRVIRALEREAGNEDTDRVVEYPKALIAN